MEICTLLWGSGTFYNDAPKMKELLNQDFPSRTKQQANCVWLEQKHDKWVQNNEVTDINIE